MRIGFMGTGEIAGAMVRALTGRGHEILVSPRNATRAAELAALADVSIAPNEVIAQRCDVVVICLMADLARALLPQLAFRAQTRVISVMADFDHAALLDAVAPARDVSITIPLAAIAVGGCPLPVYPDAGAVRDVFGADNMVFELASEAALNAHFAATSLASAAFLLAGAGADWLGEATGDRGAAEVYVLGLLSGFLAALPQDGAGRIDEALASLNTEGGLNQSVRRDLTAAGWPKDLRAALDKLRPRLGL